MIKSIYDAHLMPSFKRAGAFGSSETLFFYQSHRIPSISSIA